MNTPLILTKRLILRKFNELDLLEIYKIYSDEDINIFLPWFPIKNMKEANELYYNFYLANYEKKEAYLYAICLKDNKAIGYLHLSIEDSHDLGYALLKEYQGNGYVLEGALALIEILKKEGFKYITATHDILNYKSGRVMQKLGMQYMYTYQELWQPKNKIVYFRLYQLNIDKVDRVYEKYLKESPQSFYELKMKKENV